MATRLCISSVKPQLELQHRDTKEKSWSRHYFVDNQRKTMKDLQLYYTVKWYIHIYIYICTLMYVDLYAFSYDYSLSISYGQCRIECTTVGGQVVI